MKNIRAFKGKDLYAVVDKNGLLIHRDGGSVSIFWDKKTAEFLAYEWAEPSEKLRVIKIKVTTPTPKKD